MRKLVLAAGLALVASGAQAASYLDTFGTVHDPILTTAGGLRRETEIWPGGCQEGEAATRSIGLDP